MQKFLIPLHSSEGVEEDMCLVELTHAQADRILDIMKLITEKGFFTVTIYEQASFFRWDGDNAILGAVYDHDEPPECPLAVDHDFELPEEIAAARIDLGECVIMDKEVHWSAVIKHTDVQVTSRPLSKAQIRKIAGLKAR